MILAFKTVLAPKSLATGQVECRGLQAINDAWFVVEVEERGGEKWVSKWWNTR